MPSWLPRELQSALAVIGLLSPLLSLGIVAWLARYFVRNKDYVTDRTADALTRQEKQDTLHRRIDPVQKACTETATAVTMLANRMTANEGHQLTTARDLGKLETAVLKLEDQGTLNKQEIIAAFQEKAEQITKNVHALETQVARLDERLRISKTTPQGAQ